MEQANPFRLEGIYKGLAGSLIGQVPYGYVEFSGLKNHRSFLKAHSDVIEINHNKGAYVRFV